MKKIGLLALALVLALGTLGIGYALWFENLYIQGTVYTGDLDATWSVEGYGDNEAPNKDVSWVDAYYCGDTLYVTVYNAYPCITYWVYFDITNTGTIPFHICPLSCDFTNFPGTVHVDDLSCAQVHPGYSAYGYINIHLDNSAHELETYTFSCTQTVVQYNEPCPD